MFGSKNFYGSATVGERGQIVLPAKLRDDMGIRPGDKLLVLSGGPTDRGVIMIMRADVLDEIVHRMSQHFQELIDRARNEDGGGE